MIFTVPGRCVSLLYIEVVKLLRGCGAGDIGEAAFCAARGGQIGIVELCQNWLGFNRLHHELFQYHHKREFSRGVREDLLPIAWHPDRFWSWCVDEDGRRFIESVWRS